MNRILSILILVILCLLSGTASLQAQKDTGAQRIKQGVLKATDSEKNQILINQSDVFRSIQIDRMDDSIRLQQLNKEINELTSKDTKKKEELTAELDQIQSRDSANYRILKHKIDSMRSIVTGFPVLLDYDTVFYIYARLGSLTPEYRARLLSDRLQKLSDDYLFNADSLVIVASGLSTVDITYKDDVIKSVSDIDAIWENTNPPTLAVKYRDHMISAIKKYKKEHSLQAKIRDISLAALVLAIFVFLVYAFTKLFQWIKRRLERQRGNRFKGVKIRNYEFLDTGRQMSVIFSALRILQWICYLVLLYFALLVLLGIFPWTGGLGTKMVSFFLEPTKKILISVWFYLPNFFTIIIVIILFRYFLRIMAFFKHEIEKGNLKIPGFYVDWANPTFQIIRVLVFAFMLIVIFPYLPGSNSPIFKGVSVFLGVLFTFGSAGALGNLVSGLVLTYMRAYKIGDRIQIGQITGDVVEKSILVTKIKTIKNEIVSIPNSTVMASHTTNYSADALEHGLILHTSVTIGYDTPWRQIHELLIKAALATNMIEKDPAPFVFQEALNDFYVCYQINAYTRVPKQQHIIYSLLHQNIQDTFNEAGVEIMSPHYSNLRDGNKSTVPSDHLPNDYTAPSFRFKNTDKP
jgi:small-conductance mechanosensitive channel